MDRARTFWQTHNFDDRLRRVLDIAVSASALLLLSPLMLLIALAIVLESGRPILFLQPRLGQYGRIFYMLKFRKFHNHWRADGLPLTLAQDTRLTLAGKVLRATKLDELPQLFNVLWGDMSIIGPRPESLAFADCFKDGFEAVLQHKPGILGPSQAAFRAEHEFFPAHGELTEFYRYVLFPLKALVDLKYYCNRTLISDIMWIGVSALSVFGVSLSVIPFQRFRMQSKRRGRPGLAVRSRWEVNDDA
jgi:lipopolysaccharide/colanic/teichoic acid biosynthesis glycosyltransferase